ncbi:homeobox-leucine zipper protein HDG8-like [Solanum pennellii]|uniref:Homeobox-leucine zipper protein HDG8-like n=1 Tax=Solanum pennellii TaxID=28526 RepID=A0ABM1VI74_SOLPN|nr:homeobox-leucine zipper protein HDG8-like [Solanum pennellii]
MNDPFWVDSSSDRQCFIHREIYGRKFSNQVLPPQTSTGRIESSKDCGIVSMTAVELIHNFLDPVKWMNLFPTIVTKPKTIEVLDSGTWGGSMQLMYEKLHILSPLVEAREFFFIRCCRQLDATTWIMVDISYDIFNGIQCGVPCYSLKFPSGCAIQDMGNGQSKVTWVEHVQVYEKYQVNHIFRDLLCDHEAYGAKRWIVTLQRMCERFNFQKGSTYPTRHDFKGVFHDPEGLKNTIKVSQRMVKSFFEILSMTDNRGDRISIRKNEEIIQPKGFIAIATTSLWLPLSFQDVFSFFNNDKTRNQVCVEPLYNNVNYSEIFFGTFPGNNITIIQPYSMHKEMLVLEETSIDEMGAFLVYAPIDLRAITSIVNGGDATKVPILPSGIIISPDGRLSLNRDNTANAQNGSILTMTFQIMICGNNNPTSRQQKMEVVGSVHGVLSATILRIKEALGCSDL